MVSFAPPYKEIIWDLDGSLTSAGPNSFAVLPYPWNAWPECAPGGAPFSGASICSGGAVEVRKLAVFNSLKAFDYLPLNVTSAAGGGQVTFRPGQDFYGWTLPVVTRKGGYNMSWPTGGDWAALKVRYSEPEYTPSGASEWAIVQFTTPTARFRNRVMYQSTRERSAKVAPLQPTIDVHGTGAMAASDNKTWALLLNARGLSAPAVPADTFLLDVTAVLCPPEGCLAASSQPSFGGNFSLWSAPATWPSGAVPGEGESPTIPANVSVLFDIAASPRLRTLTILGSLTFADTGVYRALHLENLLVLGALTIGTRAAPYASAADVVFYGDYSGEQLRVDANLLLGNKVLVALGNVSIVAPAPNTTWTRLNATATAGASSIVLATSVGSEWAIGDAVILGSTSYAWDDSETATVASVSADGRTLGLSAPLRNTHYAGTVLRDSSLPGGAVTLAAPVGRLTRRIRLIANLTSPGDEYGFHLVAASSSAAAGQARSGVLDLVGVELRGCGQAISSKA